MTTKDQDIECYERDKKIIQEAFPRIIRSLWIPVSDRLPKEGMLVLTIHDDNEYGISSLTDGSWGGFTRSKSVRTSVTHWMPLPPNP